MKRTMKRQIINTAAPLKIYGICATMMCACAFAANNASAQTEPCPNEGETRLSKSFGGGVSDTGCVPDDAVAIMEDCEEAGWLGLNAGTTTPSLKWVVCGLPSQLFNETGFTGATSCWILRGASIREPSCVNMFGDPPVFPRTADHPNVQTDGVSTSPNVFVANCDRNGAVPGGYPPDKNIDGEYECSCDLDSHIGAWPDCVAAPDLNRAQREAVSACLSQGWTVSTTTSPIKCEIPLTSGGTDGMSHDGCFFSGGTPLCDEVFGAEYAFPAALSPLAQGLVDGFRNVGDLQTDTYGAAAAAYADAVLGRYRGESNYIDGAISHRGSLRTAIGGKFLLAEVFQDNGIPFSPGEANTDAKLMEAIRAAFEEIPVREPYVFNCGAGMIPARANTNGATECVRQTNLFLRLRVFLEGPLR